jgi:hypothetical protein
MNDAETLAEIRELDAADLPPADRADVTALKRDRRVLLALLDRYQPRQEDGLDVERLALAMAAVIDAPNGPDGLCEADAEQIAAEYARLAPEGSDGE